MFTLFRVLIMVFFTTLAHATGGFEKSTLWSARAAQYGGAYSSSVSGAEALYFNPASLQAETDKEFQFGLGISSGTTKAPIIESNHEVKSFSGPVTPLSIMYSQKISNKEAIGLGIYSVGGLSVGYDDVNLSSLGSEFNSFHPDVFGRLSVLEVGLGYSKKLSSNLSIGGTLRNHLVNGGFSQVQVTEARGLGGMGIPDGTVLAVSNGVFDDLQGFAFGAYTVGLNYQNDGRDFGGALVYRSQVNVNLRTKGSGTIVYSNTGALATGATAGQIYKLSGNQTSITSSLPEAWTVSFFKKITKNNKFHFEYMWAEYSHNDELGIDGSLNNPVDNTTTKVPNVPLNWHDLHEFKLGWTNTSIDSWIIGGGYSLSLPVTDKHTAGPTFAAPANYHNLYFGLGKRFQNFRIDGAYENYFSSGNGSTQESVNGNQVSPSIMGSYASRCYSFIFSLTYFI